MAEEKRKETVVDRSGRGKPAAGALVDTAAEGVALLASVEHIELEQAWSRMRFGTQIGIFVWFFFGAFDVAYALWIDANALWPLVALRFLPPIIFIPFIFVLMSKEKHTARRLATIDWVVFQSAVWVLAAMTVWTGGFFSNHAAGIAVVLAVRTAAVAEPWRKGLLANLSASLSYPIVTLIGTLFSSDLAAQAGDPAAWTIWAVNCANLFGVAFFAVVGGDALWHARRQLFESRSIGRYRLLRRIGKGGMGEVWAAWHRGLKREVALKLLTPRQGEHRSVQRFEREVAATVGLSHPNTIRVFDHGATDDGIWYYAMELLEGEDLAAIVGRAGPLPVDRTIYLLAQVGRSLAEAHLRGIVHRDIKPENIFITDDGRYTDFVKVLDFGIARMAEEDVALTQTGFTMGTPAYLSPEVARGERGDARSDVYALGCLLQFMLTGQPPFSNKNVAELLQAHLGEAPEPIADARGEEIGADLDAVVRRSLAKDPKERFQSAGEVVTALEACEGYGRWQPPVSVMAPSSSPMSIDPLASTLAE